MKSTGPSFDCVVGIDVSKRQVEANREQLAHAKRSGLKDITHDPTWIVGDGENVAALLADALRAKPQLGPTLSDL